MDIEEKLISERNNNISKAICGKDLYDYSQLEDVYYVFRRESGHADKNEYVNVSTDEGYYRFMEMFKKNQPRNSDYQYHEYVKDNCVYKRTGSTGSGFVEKHYKLLTGEKIVFLWDNRKPIKECYPTCTNYNSSIHNRFNLIIVTNFSRVFSYNFSGLYTGSLEKFAHYNFWLPVDYILILKSLVLNNYKPNGSSDTAFLFCNTPFEKLSTQELNLKFPNYGTQIDPNTIFSTLELMKSTLYNRKFIPLYVKDVIEENKMLKEKMKEYDTFNKEKEEFLKENKPYLDLIEDKKNLDLIREELRLEKEKLKLVALKLKHDKLDFNEKLEKFQNLDIDDALK